MGADRGIEYDDDRLNEVAKSILDIVITYDSKSEWLPAIRDILLYDMNLPRNYISSHFMVNTINTYLNDLKWTPAETIMAGIGQSVTQVTPIAVARYTAAIANGGTVYDAQIIDKVIDADGNIVVQKEPVVANPDRYQPGLLRRHSRGHGRGYIGRKRRYRRRAVRQFQIQDRRKDGNVSAYQARP